MSYSKITPMTMTSTIEEYCGGALWDYQSNWNTSSPHLTECFRKTILVWIPSFYLLLFLPVLIYHFAKTIQNSRWNRYNTVRQMIAFAMNVVTLADLIIAAKDYHENKLNVDIVNAVLRFVVSIVVSVLFYLFATKSIYTSGIVWSYLGLSSICMTLEAVSAIFLDQTHFQKRTDTLTVINCFLTLILFAQSFVSDTGSFKTKEQEKICPKKTASFFSRLTFSWFSSLVYLGWKRPIVMEDVWLTRKQDSALYNYEKFEHYLDQHQVPQQSNATEDKPAVRVNILKIIWFSYAWYFVTGSMIKIFNDVAIFISPMIMKKLMSFVSDQSEPSWHGYILVSTMFLVIMVQILSLNHYNIRMDIFAMRVKTQIIAALYRKALKLSSGSRSKYTTGEIVNLMSVDAQRFIHSSSMVNLLWSAPFQIVLAMTLLWYELGIAVLGGFILMVILIPVNLFIMRRFEKLETNQMTLKDERVKSMNEVLNGIKILKLYGWEQAFMNNVQKLRKLELNNLLHLNYLLGAMMFIWTVAPFLVTFITFAIYVLVDENNVLTPQKAFVSLVLFNILRFPMMILPDVIINLIMTAVSIKRINNFLSSSELTDYIGNNDEDDEKHCINLDGCNFGWSSSENETNKKDNKESKNYLKNISLKIQKNSFVAIVGNVGSGKSSLLNAILGNMELSDGSIKVSKSKKIAYTPQEAWIQNSTLRDNILFGKEFNKEYYRKVVYACSLAQDFDILPGGDMTEIGEKGINLSGGQKQRVSLARACYCDADIYLLDDPLAAVDSHVGNHIFENIIHSETGLLRNKTRILVTNNLSVLPYTDTIVVLNNGEISEYGTYEELMQQRNHFYDLIHQYSLNEKNSKETSKNKENKPEDKENEFNFEENKLVEKEEIQVGNISMSVFFQYMKAISWFWVALSAGNYLLDHTFNVGSSVWLSEWSKQSLKFTNYTDSINSTTITGAAICNRQSSSDTFYYLWIYGAIGISRGLFDGLGWYSLSRGAMRAAKYLHDRMLLTILRSPMSFFDVTPIGRILNRFSKDIDVIDSNMSNNIRLLFYCLFSTLSTLIVISIPNRIFALLFGLMETYHDESNIELNFCYSITIIIDLPIFLVVILPVGIGFYIIQRLYVATARQLKRLESVSKSPIYSHFSETLSGVATIRAFSAGPQFISRSDSYVDINNSSYFAAMISECWLSIRLEFISNLVVLMAGVFAVIYRDNLDAASVGLIISYALDTTEMLNFLVQETSDLETNLVGVERIMEYTDLKMEAEWNLPNIRLPTRWPLNGLVDFVGYETRYRDGLDLVLKGITVSIKEGEKIGIVGRTGAGKSSLTLALFRLIEPTNGCIRVDGLDISKLGLHQLRQHLTIIPQDPVLFCGTVRFNLDPFDTYSDEEIWTSLELAHLKQYVQSLDDGLSHSISEGGGNLSIGQKQLICLARALLRKTKVLILDEATAAVDMETDALIQRTIKQCFSECTILTIAHRLNTIIDSTRVLVLDFGQVSEFDSPENLLNNPNSLFYSLADSAGLINRDSIEQSLIEM